MEPITWFVNDRGDLEIHLDDEEARADLIVDIENNEYGFIAIETQWLERLILESDYQWIDPYDIAALTSAPILGIVDRNERGDVIQKIHSLFWYPNYQIRSFAEDLAETGKCIFNKAPEDN